MFKGKIDVKTPAEIKIMAEGGKKLAKVKAALRAEIKAGVSAEVIDKLAESLIRKCGGKPSFQMVKGYFWTVCINTNDGIVHGIPHPEIVFKDGDIVSVDVGMFYKGFHTDTSFTVGIGVRGENKKFLEIGAKALNNAIKKAKVGAKIYDISEAIENTLGANKFSPIRDLVGHGVGRKLHEDPQIPCFTSGSRGSSPTIPLGATLAIEIMYTKGSPEVYIDPSDKWTIRTKDGKISALFEETIAVTDKGPIVLTK